MTLSLNRRAILSGMAAGSAALPMAASAATLADARFQRDHVGQFNGQRVPYRAVMQHMDVFADADMPSARFVYTAYVRQPVQIDRPVIFLFNGGPIVASTYLHVGAFGPVRYDPPKDVTAPVAASQEPLANDDSLLDVADLVFIDPPETGFSRLHNPADAARASSDTVDSALTAAFIRQWVAIENRAASPLYLVGESYGTLRAANVAGMLADDLPLSGVALLGQALNMVETTQRRANGLSYAVNLPALTAIAAYHGRIPGSDDIRARIEEAWDFAMGDYVNALRRLNHLSDAERQSIARRLQDLSGISADYYLAHRLVIPKMTFTRELFRAEGQAVGVYDGRYKGPVSEGDPYEKVNALIPPLMARHLRDNLGVTLDMADYRAAAPRVAPWQYQPTGGAGGPFDDYDYDRGIARAMQAKADFRLLIGTGIYDTTTTLGAARYLLAQATYPIERVVMKEYEGGHMAYSNPDARTEMARDLRAFVTASAVSA